MSLSDVYRERHYSRGYVYIARSLAACAMKIGTTVSIPVHRTVIGWSNNSSSR